MAEFNKQTPNKPGQPGNTIGNRWKPGESGNPSGRPKDPGITAGQLKQLDEVCPFDGQGRTWRQYLEEKGLLQASESHRAMDNFKDRVEGKVTQTIGGDSEKPIYIINIPTEEGKKNLERVMKGEGT